MSKINSHLQISFPSEVKRIIKICLDENIQIVLYGGAIRDYFLNEKPNDYDFYIACQKDRFSKLLLKVGYQLREYGNFLVPHAEVYYVKCTSDIKVDISFLPEFNLLKQEALLKLHSRWAYGTTINMMLYYPSKALLFDPYMGVRDIKNKLLSSAFSDKDIRQEEYFDKFTLVIFSKLIGRCHDFSIDRKLLSTINKYNKNLNYHSPYLEQFPWRQFTLLATVLTLQFSGLARVISFWAENHIAPIIFPTINLNAKLLDSTITDLKKSKDNFKKFDLLNKLSNFELSKHAKLKKNQPPDSFLSAMKVEAIRLLHYMQEK